MKLLLISLSILLLIPNFLHVKLEPTPVYDHIEKYDTSLGYITSIKQLIHVADSIALARKIDKDSLKYAITVATLIRNRFYHGFSQYPLNENWIAAVGEYCFGYGLASIVKPDDILKYHYGGCSQQTIVLMEVMKNKNISYRSVGFPHHYASELQINGKWYFFDPNMEPSISDSQRLESNWNGYPDSLKKYYDRTHFSDLDWKFGKNLRVTRGNINSKVAPNAALFQLVTHYLSRTLWIIPLVIALKIRKSAKAGRSLVQ